MNFRTILKLLKLEKQFGNKPWYRSFTGWGLLLLLIGASGLDVACGNQVNTWEGTQNIKGLLPEWLCTAQTSEQLGLILSIFGIRRRQ